MEKTFIFDFDGTIADSFEIIVRIIRENKENFKADIDNPELYNKLRDLPAEKVLQYLNVPINKISDYVNLINTRMSLYINDLRLVEGMEETIQRCATEGIFQGILSSNSPENINSFLIKNKIDSYFSFVLTDSTLFNKENGLIEIINTYKLPKKDIWFIGDEPRDIRAGKKVGVNTIGVTWGISSRKLLQERCPTKIVDAPSELIGLAL